MTTDGVLPLSSFVNITESGADENVSMRNASPRLGCERTVLRYKNGHMNKRHQGVFLAREAVIGLHSFWKQNMFGGHPSAPYQCAHTQQIQAKSPIHKVKDTH